MNISTTASMTGLPAKTIRYYEDIGLVVPDRSPNGYRRYDADHVHRLAFIQRARGLGFGIEECRGLLSLYDDKQRASADVKRIAEEKIEEIDRKLAELNAMRATLTHLAQTCHGDDRPDCPILDDLATGLGAD
jgi:Cu(I)-responsive transcriptional regulator